MLELAIGYDYVMPTCNGGYFFARVSAEWQDWYNFSSAFRTVDNGGGVQDNRFNGPADVGFGGFGFGVGVIR